MQRGYVVAAVDIRGTGGSDGRLIPYEYSDIEHQDGEAVIDWLSRQSWSTGKVGMFGISWGGFNSIQMALRNPPALKAIIAVDATEDLYQEDVHFIDGIIQELIISALAGPIGWLKAGVTAPGKARRPCRSCRCRCSR